MVPTIHRNSALQGASEFKGTPTSKRERWYLRENDSDEDSRPHCFGYGSYSDGDKSVGAGGAQDNFKSCTSLPGCCEAASLGWRCKGASGSCPRRSH